MIVFDLTNLPRPERSGWYGVVLAIGLLYFAVTPLPDGSQGSFECTVMPWRCASPQRAESHPKYNYHTVMFSPFGTGKQTVCSCHPDVRPWGRKIEHFRMREEPTCDSNGTEPREWTAAPKSLCPDGSACGTLTVVQDGNPVEFSGNFGEYRWHCTDELRLGQDSVSQKD
jgi:hypothetical protein